MGKYMLEISNDSADAIFKDMLYDDYVGLRKSIQELEETPNLLPYQQEDLETDRTDIAAMEVMLKYYFTADELEERNSNAEFTFTHLL